MSGYISTPLPGNGRSSADRHWYFLNGRPCHLPKLARTLNDVFRQYATTSGAQVYPAVVLQLQLEAGTYDVNVTPDKRTVMVHDEAAIVEVLRVCEG